VCSEGVCVPAECVPRTGDIAFTGLEAAGEGCAAWNTDAHAPEAEAWGHAISWAPSCLAYAYSYLASRDHVGGTGQAFQLTSVQDGFPAFTAALAGLGAGIGIEDVTARFTPMSLGGDVEGTDWSYEPSTTTETRRYTGGTLTLSLVGEPMVTGPMPDLTVSVAYGDVADCADDGISGTTPAVLLQDASSGSSASAQTAAAAFLEDVGAFGVAIAFDSLQPVGSVEFVEGGRTGAFFEAATGMLSIGRDPLDPDCP